MSLLHKFDAIDANELVDFLIERKDLLPIELLLRIERNFCQDSERFRTLPSTPAAPTYQITDDFDLKAEIMEQMMAVRTLRERATEGEPLSIRETKEALSATTSLLTLLTKINGEVYNQDRVRLLQICTIEVLKDFDPELQDKFVDLLEAKLSK
jgi:hypothetical protein